MRVYRVIEDVWFYLEDGRKINEYQDYMNGIISVPKTSFNDGINTHNYEKGVSYLHFFHFYEGALEYVSGIDSIGCDDKCYIVSYDISDDILDKYRGLGIYPESIHPAVPLLEYAIPVDKLDNHFITGEIRKYNLRDEYSLEYKNYLLGDYQKVIDELDDENKRFIKTYIESQKR